MQNCQNLRTTLRTFMADDCGGSFMEYTLIAALAVVVGGLVVLAVRKFAVAPV